MAGASARGGVARGVVAALALLVPTPGCSDEPPGGGAGASGGDSGAPAGCAPGDRPRPDGSCAPPGVAACGAGFTADGADGCGPILPSDACGPGTMAVPGETACREVAPCSAGRWGAIPIAGATQFVDRSYPGGDSDGSEARPWTTVQDAVDAAAPGAVVAIAAGTYVEDVVVQGKTVALWGVCPAKTRVQGKPGDLAALLVLDVSDGTEIHDLAVTGAVSGIAMTGSKGVMVSQVWVHDTAGRGIDVEDDFGAAELVVTDSLVEGARGAGVFVDGAAVTVQSSVVRATRGAPDGTFGDGISVGVNEETGSAGTLTLHASVVSGNHDYGVFVEGASATVDGSLLEGTMPEESDQAYGRGVGVQADPSGRRATLDLRASVVDANHDIGVFVMESDATLEDVVIRGTLSRPSDQGGGRGLDAQGLAGGTGATLVLRSSLVASNLEHGVALFGSVATIEGTSVRDTLPREADGVFGRGVSVQRDPATSLPAMLTLSQSAIERSHDGGVFVGGSEAILDGVRIDATVARPDGTFGDGLAVVAIGGPAHAEVSGSSISASARAGISSFGATVAAGTTVLSCNVIDLDGEAFDGPYAFDDRGGNVCGCGPATSDCKVLSSSLAPPEAGDLP